MTDPALYGKFFQIGYVTRDIDLALDHLTRRFAYIDTRRQAGHYSELVYRATTTDNEPSLMAR